MRLGIGEGMEDEGGISVGRSDAGKERWFEDLRRARLFVEDAVGHSLCHCCALVQEEREVAAWERGEDEAVRLGAAEGDEEQAGLIAGQEQ